MFKAVAAHGIYSARFAFRQQCTRIPAHVRRFAGGRPASTHSTTESLNAAGPIQQLKSARNGMFIGLGGVLGLAYLVRSYFESAKQAAARANAAAPVHVDTSEARINSTAQVERTITIQHNRREDGVAVISVVGADKYNVFVANAAVQLEAARNELETAASAKLRTELAGCFTPVRDRAALFADWYFAYRTSYALMRVAAVSFARHASDVASSTPVDEAVGHDLDAYILQRYERIVLRPELTDPLLKEAYHRTIVEVHNNYKAAITRTETKLASLLQAETSHLEQPADTEVELTLDWAAQLHKVKAVPATYEKAPEMTLVLSAGGAVVGKAAGAAVGSKVAAGAIGGKVAAQSFAGKLSAPFLTKVLAGGTGMFAGAAGGPLGALLGAGIGVGIDWSVNKGIALMQRGAFVDDVEAVVNATEQEYAKCLEQELHRAVGVWVDDAVQLLPKVD